VTTSTLPSSRSAALREVIDGDDDMASGLLSSLSLDELAAIIPAATRMLGLLGLLATVELAAKAIKPSQHCTSKDCGFTQSHTAGWCGFIQPRRCECHYCYPDGGAS
jgi:hypothetical protein